MEGLHPYIFGIVADLAQMNHLQVICGLVREYCERYIIPGGEDHKTIMIGVKTALGSVMEPYQLIALADLLITLTLH